MHFNSSSCKILTFVKYYGLEMSIRRFVLLKAEDARTKPHMFTFFDYKGFDLKCLVISLLALSLENLGRYFRGYNNFLI